MSPNAVFLCLKDKQTPLPARVMAAVTVAYALSENMWADGKPKKWYYALPIIAVWLLIVWLIVRTFI